MCNKNRNAMAKTHKCSKIGTNHRMSHWMCEIGEDVVDGLRWSASLGGKTPAEEGVGAGRALSVLHCLMAVAELTKVR